MSYNPTNTARTRSFAFPAASDAIAATRFREDRLEAEMPVGTEDQVKRAQRAVENPLNSRFRTPLGLQQLALSMPLSKFERALNRLPKDEGGLGLLLRPHLSRGDNIKVEADASNVERFVEENPTMTEGEAAGAIAGMHGYTEAGLKQAFKRVERYTRQPEDGRRISSHLREKMVMFSAIAQSAMIIRNRPAPEVVA
jgi:hypothetical protein